MTSPMGHKWSGGKSRKHKLKSLITGYGQTIGLDMDKFNESVSNNAGNTKLKRPK